MRRSKPGLTLIAKLTAFALMAAVRQRSGKARAVALTPEQHEEITEQGAAARWRKNK